jgi:hypothetical protein
MTLEMTWFPPGKKKTAYFIYLAACTVGISNKLQKQID